MRRGAIARRTRGGLLFVAPVVLFLLLFISYPIVYSLVLSFTGARGQFTGLDNYRRVLADRLALHSLQVSFVYVAGSVVFQLLIGTIIGILLSRSFKGKGAARSIVLVPWVVPGAVAATTWAWMYHGDFGIARYALNAIGFTGIDRGLLTIPGAVLPALIFVNVWKMFPFVSVMVLAAIQGVETSLFEAAEVDGANYLQQVRFILLPRIRSVLFTLLLLLTIWGFNSITIIYTMTGGGPANLSLVMPIHIFQLTFQFFQINKAAAESVILFFILLVLIVGYLAAFSRSEGEAAEE